MPSPSELNRNRYLENFSTAAFSTGDNGDGATGFLARVLPSLLPVEDDAGKYHEIDMDDVMRDEMKERAPGSKIDTVDWKLDDASYMTKQYAFGQKLPEEYTAKSYPALNVEEAANAIANERAMISMEVRFKDAFWGTSKGWRDLGGATTTVADTSYIYWNRSTAKPIDDISAESVAMKVRGWRRPNTLALGAEAAAKLLTTDQVIGRLNNGQTPGGPAEASLADLAKMFKVQRVLVGDAVYNSAKQGATASKRFILDSKSAWLGYIAPRMTKYTLTAFTTITWRKLAGNDQGVRVYRRWDDSVRSWIIEVFHDDVQKQVSSALGTFFDNIVE